MKDISKIPTDELIEDKKESLKDINICERAISASIYTYSGGSVMGRLECNKRIASLINVELERRNT